MHDSQPTAPAAVAAGPRAVWHAHARGGAPLCRGVLVAARRHGTPLRRAGCPACGAPANPRFARWAYSIDECGACGLRLLNPQPDDRTLARLYTQSYFLGSENAEAQAHVSQLKCATARVYLELLRNQALPTAPSLLEVGCGRGEFLLAARDAGFQVRGVEYSPAAAAAANDRLGRDRVRVGELADAAYPDADFDVVAFFDVLEHVRQPRVFLTEVHRVLRPGGWVFLVTPSLDSWSARIMGRHWMEYKLEHLYYFNTLSLRLLLERCGFGEVTFRPNVKVLSLDLVCRHFDRFPVPLLSTLTRVLRAVTPAPLAQRPVRLVASGVAALARKPYA